MAKLSDITIKTSEYRPCTVMHGDHLVKALFHRWIAISEIVSPSLLRGGHSGGVIADTFGIVEYENGRVDKVHPESITFLDAGGKFSEYDWRENDGT